VEEQDPKACVRDRLTGEDVELRIVKSAEMLEYKAMPEVQPRDSLPCKCATAFGGAAWSSSVIVLPPRSRTAMDVSENQLKTCVLVSGQVKVSVHRSHFVMRTGGMFYIPAGNNFTLENMSATRHARVCMSEFKLFEKES